MSLDLITASWAFFVSLFTHFTGLSDFFTTFEAVLEDFANFAPVFKEAFFKSPALIWLGTSLFLVMLKTFCSCSDVLLCFLSMATAADDVTCTGRIC